MPQSPPTPQYVALDTNVLIDLAAKTDHVLDCKATIEERIRNVCFAVLPTVIQELQDLSELTGPLSGMQKWERTRDLSGSALDNLLPWGFQPIGYLPVMNGIIEETARKILGEGLVPPDQQNDSFIIAEAAALPAVMLISSDGHICNVDKASLNLLLSSCHLAQFTISSPREIVHKFFRKR